MQAFLILKTRAPQKEKSAWGPTNSKRSKFRTVAGGRNPQQRVIRPNNEVPAGPASFLRSTELASSFCREVGVYISSLGASFEERRLGCSICPDSHSSRQMAALRENKCSRLSPDYEQGV